MSAQDQYLSPEPGKEVCDFCCRAEAKVTWAYDCGDFMFPSVPNLPPPPTGAVTMHGSSGAWAACDRCHDYIEAGDINGLLYYGMKGLRRKLARWGFGSQEISALELQRRAVTELFFLHHKGPAIPNREWIDSQP